MILTAVVLAGCGYVGGPLPPALRIPVQITDLRAVQRGGRILVTFTPPTETTEKLALTKVPEIELRVGETPKESFEIQRWAADAKRIDLADARSGGVEVSIPAAEWANREVIIAVRAIGPTKRPADWSNPLLLRVEASLRPPEALTAAGTTDGPYVRWKGPGTRWRVWRLDEDARQPQLLGVTGEPAWLDRTAVLGKNYTYMIQQLVGDPERPAESEMSAEVRIKHEDKFPPAVPVGLSAITALKTVELSWDRNTEADLKGYQVYRAEGDAALAKVGAVVEKPTFSDPGAASGKTHRYAVAAVDESGNESQACPAVEVIAP